MKRYDFLINKCIDNYIKTIINCDDATNLNDVDSKHDFFIDDYSSIIILLSTYITIYRDNLVRNTLKKYVLKVIQKLNSINDIDLSLCYGLTGIAFSLRLSEKFLPEMTSYFNDFNDLYMIFLKKLLKIEVKKLKENILYESDYDLINGLSSCLAYLSFSKDHPLKIENKNNLILFFKLLSDRNTNGIPNFVVNKDHIENNNISEEFKSGYINLGVSHGLAGPIAAISLFNESKILKKYNKLYENIIKTNYENTLSPVPIMISIDSFKKESYKSIYVDRCSWCYGSPGIMRSLYLSAKKSNNKDLEKYSIKYFLNLDKFELSDMKLTSPTFCHGISGLIAILNAMERDTNIYKFKKIKQKLLYSLLKKADFNNKIIFKNYDIVSREIKFENKKYTNDIGILNGSTGIILTLLSVKSSTRLDWERIFLIS